MFPDGGASRLRAQGCKEKSDGCRPQCGNVQVDFEDVSSQTIRDEVDIKTYNTQFVRDRAGSIQFTFGWNVEGALLVDIDRDDHAGLQHVAYVLGHIFSGKQIDPDDIRRSIRFFRRLDVEYRL